MFSLMRKNNKVQIHVFGENSLFLHLFLNPVFPQPHGHGSRPERACRAAYWPVLCVAQGRNGGETGMN